jgi:hypothetical protein
MPKGAPNKSTATRGRAEAPFPEKQANLPFYSTDGPTNRKANEITTAPKSLNETKPTHPKKAPLMLPDSLDL